MAHRVLVVVNTQDTWTGPRRYQFLTVIAGTQDTLQSFLLQVQILQQEDFFCGTVVLGSNFAVYAKDATALCVTRGRGALVRL